LTFQTENEARLKAVLASFLPDMSDEERLSQYAFERGIDVASANQDARNIILADVEALSVLAARGKVLPLMVHTAFDLIKRKDSGYGCYFLEVDGIEVPDVTSVIERGFVLLNEASFKENLQGVFSVSKRVASGPARWFFAFIASEVSIERMRHGDAFWSDKSRDMMRSLLAVSAHLQTRSLDMSLYTEACNLDPVRMSTWEHKGFVQLDNRFGAKTVSSILAMINRNVHWCFASAHEEMHYLN
jgi:hypothetical protein